MMVAARSVSPRDRNQLVAWACTQADEACSTARFRRWHVRRDSVRGLLYAAVPSASPATLGDGREPKLVGVVPVMIAITRNVNDNAATLLPDSRHR
jgi:hypothetical protein